MNLEKIFRTKEETEFIKNWIDVTEYIVMSTWFFEYDLSDEIIERIIEKISFEIIQQNKRKICFDIVAEGIPVGIIWPLNKLVKKLIDTKGFTLDQFKIVFGASAHYKNYEFYLDSINRLNLLHIPAIFMNNYELLFSAKIIRNIEIYQSINQRPRIKSKKFLCYNRNVKAHRVYLTAAMLSKNLLDKGYFSMYIHGGLEHGMGEYSRYNIRDLEKYFPKTWEVAAYSIEKNIHKFPITLSLGVNNAHNMHEITPEDLIHYTDSYFGVITETKFFHDKFDDLHVTKSDLSLNAYLFSEKTYKFIAGKLPFIMVGFTGSLQALRDLGYRTFYPYINESYDLIEDDEQRMIAVIAEIERLCNLSDDKWILIQERLKEVVDHNFNMLLNATNNSYEP